jgi:hypothetical protein
METVEKIRKWRVLNGNGNLNDRIEKARIIRALTSKMAEA